MKKILAVCLFFLAFQTQLVAQETSFTLTKVIQIARENSTAWLSAETRRENQYWQYKTFKTDYAPQLLLNSTLPSFNKSVVPVTQPDGNVIYRDVNNNTLQMQLGLSQAIGPTGGMVTVSTDLSRYDDFIQDYVQYSGQPIYIGLNQPILKFNAYKWDKQIKPLVYEESKKKYFEELEQISVKATTLFFDLLMAQIKMEVSSKNVESNDSIYKIAQARYHLGKLTENDLLQLELNVINSKLEVSQASVSLQTATLNLQSFVGLANNTIKLIAPKTIPSFQVDEEQALTEARTNKANLVSYKRRKLEALQQVNYAKRTSGVSMELQAAYGLNNQGGSVDQVYQNPLDGMRIGLQMNVPLVDWGRKKARTMTAEANLKLAEFQLQQEETAFEQDIRIHVRNFKVLYEQVESRKQSDAIAAKAYALSKRLFLTGKISITDLNAALVAKDNARLSYIASLKDYWVAYYQLREKTLYDFEHQQLLVRNIDNSR